MKKYILLVFTGIIHFSLCYSQTVMLPDSIPNVIDPDDYTVSVRNGDTLYIQKPKIASFVHEGQEIPATRSPQGMASPYALPPLIPADTLLEIDLLPRLPSSYSVDKNKDVGGIPIESATVNGALTHQVPIEVYPGSNNMQPQISLVYNSFAKNGIAGYGWSIGGLSVITVAHSNYYYDGTAAKAAKADKNSAYMLDGVRLIKTGESTSRINYQSETGLIEVVNHAPSGKYYFEVFYPDGKKAIYGYETTTAAKISYPVTKIEDQFGNYVRYTYTASNNVNYINQIAYGTKSAQAGSVKFGYTARTDVEKSYFAGQTISMDKILSKIETFYKTTLLKTYSFSYDSNEYNNFLGKIHCKAGTKEYNPLLFYYGKGGISLGHTIQQTGTMNLNEGSFQLTFTDMIRKKGMFFNSSLSEGVIIYPKFNVYSIRVRDSKNNYEYGSSYDPAQKLLVYSGLAVGNNSAFKIDAGRGFQQLEAMDINGDGFDELVRINYWYEKPGSLLSLTIYDKLMNPSYFSISLAGSVSEGNFTSPMPREFISGDFTGDGKIKLMAISGCKLPKEDGPATTVEIFDLNTKIKIHNTKPFSYDYFKDCIFAVDYDGDGKTDVCLVNGNGTYIYTLINGTFQQVAFTNALNRQHLTTDKRPFLIGDMNADGVIDFLLGPKTDDFVMDSRYVNCGTCLFCKNGNGGETRPPWEAGNPGDGGVSPIDPGGGGLVPPGFCSNFILVNEKIYNATASEWTIISGTGTGFVSTGFQLFHVDSDIGQNFLLTDLNNDGYPDLVVKENKRPDLEAIEKNKLYAHQNSRGKLSKFKLGATTIDANSVLIEGGISNSYSHGRKKNHLLCIKDKAIKVYRVSANDGKNKLLTGLINSTGAVSKISYANTVYDDRCYWPGNMLHYTYPYSSYDVNMNVVSQVSSYLDNTLFSSKTYEYENAVIHRQGLGLRCFENIVEYDQMTARRAVRKSDPVQFGLVTELDSPLSNIKYDYSGSSVTDKKIAYIKLASETEKDKVKNMTTTTAYTYDPYGNPLTQITDYGNGIKTSVTRQYNNYTATPRYRIGLPAEEIVKNERTGTEPVSTKSVYAYDANWQVLSGKQYYNGNQVSEESFTYDNSGRLIEARTKAYTSTTWLSTKYDSDELNRIRRTTSPDGTYTENSYDAKGQLSRSVDQKGNAVSYQYDEWGRLKTTSYPDGSTENITLSWVAAPAGALYMQAVTMTGSPAGQVYYNALGQEIRQGQMRFDGKYLYTDTEYDSRGRVKRVSMPFKGSSPALWNTYEHDSYDRVTALNYASGKRDVYSYNGNTVTSVIDSISTTRTYDNSGNLASVKDSAGTITYKLRADGQPASIVTPGNVTTGFEYDKYGRKTAINDPSAGKKTYAYDAAGNISKETDARGKVLNMSYDAYNRLKTKEVSGEQTVTYTYDPDGLLISETSTNGTSKAYTYDSKMQLTAEKETVVNGKWLQKTYTYSNGVMVSTAYTSNTGTIGTENYTYANGHLTEIKLGTVSIWKLSAENNLGLPTQALTGPLTRTYGYDNYGLPTSRTVKNGTAVIQNFSYNFNPRTGNLNWRKDNGRGKTENFTYDGLNRLKTFAGHTASYDVKGNITGMSHVGSFTYNTTKPYAIETVTPYGTSVPLRQQTVTYNAMMRPVSVSENNYAANLTYNGSGERVKMEVRKNNTAELTRHYIGGQYETDAGVAGTKERLYLGGDAYSAAAVYVKQGTGAWTLHYICRDYLGSITHITNSGGTLVQELSYDAWGRLRNPVNQAVYAADAEPVLFLGRGYTGHEHLSVFGLVNMNARLYDPVLGRFLSPDPYVQMPDFSQNFNRYSYCLNNPLRYTDPNGEFIIPILVGIGIGSAIGAGSAAIAYTTHALITGHWNLNNFGAAIGMGALCGGLAGGIGAAGSFLGSFGNSFGYNMLGHISSSSITNVLFDNEITLSSLTGTVVGSAVGALLPNYNAIKGSALKNMLAEVGHNTVKGSITGLASGLAVATLDENPSAIWQNTLGGVIGGMSNALAMNTLFGTPYIAGGKGYYAHKKNQPLFRKGGLLLREGGQGVTIGRNLVADGTKDIESHEFTHFLQQEKMGWARFYTKVFGDYISAQIKTGDWQNTYYAPGHIEYSTNYFSSKYLIAW